MKSGGVVREILWEIEKSVAKTKSDEVSAVSINILNLFPLSELLDEEWRGGERDT